MAMSYKQIQDAVIRKCCDSSQREDVQTAIQFRHAWLWDLEDWSFRYKVFNGVTFTANSQVVSNVPANLHAVVALYDSQGSFIGGVQDLRTFFDSANANQTLGVAKPGSYTVVDSQIFTDTLGDGTNGLLVYESSKPPLVDDEDMSGLPDGYDLALVHGGKAEMFKLQIVPDLAASFDADFTAAANALTRNYLRQVKETGQQMGAYRADVWR